ncbi:MAG: type II secretion system F family protein [Actinomycetota bacterium]
MNEVLLAVTSSVAVIGFTGGLAKIKTRRMSSLAIARLGPRSPRPEVVKEKTPILAGVAERLAATSTGERLNAYATKVHPNVAFHDVVAFILIGLIGGALVGSLVFGDGPLVLASIAGGPLIIDRIGVKLGGRRTSRLEQQLPEALSLQSSALKAGHSTSQSLRAIANQSAPPLSDEVLRAIQQVDIGVPLEEALVGLSTRSVSRDVELWVTAMQVHRITGGNLASILESLAKQVRERSHMRSEIKALTAQGRLSGLVVALAPIAFFVLLSVTSKEQMRVLYSTSLGLVLLTAGISMEIAGFLWIRWILKIKL